MREADLNARHTEGLRDLERYHRSGDTAALGRARAALRAVVGGMTARTPGRDVHLRNLAHAEQEWYQHSGDVAVLAGAVDLFHRAVAAAPDDGPYTAVHLYGLGRALHRLHGHTGDLGHLAESVAAQRRALTHPHAYPRERAAQAAGLAETLADLHLAGGDPGALREALAWQRQALDHTPDDSPEVVTRRITLAAYLAQWHQAAPDASVLDEAVDLLRHARGAAARGGFPEPWQLPVNLAGLLEERHELLGRPEDLEEAVALIQRAVAAEPSRRAWLLVRLSDLLLLRSAREPDARSADRAVAVLRQALREAPGQVDPGAVLVKLGQAYARRHGVTDDPADLEAALGQQRAAVDALEHDPHTLRAALGSLALLLLQRHERTGDEADLDEAIGLQRRALSGMPDGAGGATTHRVTLGRCLLQRFHLRRDSADLDRCDGHLLRALGELPDGQPERVTVLDALGSARIARYEHTGDRRCLDEAIALQRSAVAACPGGDARRPLVLGNLALWLRLRHDADADAGAGAGTDDVDEAVGLLRQLLAGTGHQQEQRRVSLDGLAQALRSRYARRGSVPDLEEAVAVLRTLVDSYPPGHPAQVGPHLVLAEALYQLALRREEREGPQDRALLVEAREVARAAAAVDAAPVDVRLRARRTWGQVNGVLHDWEAAARVLREATALLPRLAARDLRRSDQQYVLARVPGLAAEAAAYALQAGRPEQALEVLEHGRGVLLNRMLRTRDTDIDTLRRAAPELAERFVRLRDAQDPPPRADAPARTAAADDARWAQRWGAREAEWADVLARVRALPGLADFLRPPTARQILRQAGDGPVVLLNVSVRCDALILAGGRLDVLPLHTTAEEVHQRVAAFLADVHAPAATFAQRVARQGRVFDVLEWLWDTVTGPVLRRLAPAASGPAGPPRVWWCPQGPLAFLPLHAAGYHGPRADPARPRCAFAAAVSSYTPTVAALHHARRGPPDTTGEYVSRALVVAMSRTPGAGPLASADAEARTVTDRLPPSVRPVTLADADATRERVLRALHQARSAHFACHARADPQDPSAGGVLTHDHRARPLTAGDIAGLRLAGADLAFLSACATSLTRYDLADEAVHLTGAFQLAGFRNVVGTLWPVGDAFAPQLAESFYASHAALAAQGRADAAARALHRAVGALHERYAAFPSLWASHVHVGG